MTDLRVIDGKKTVGYIGDLLKCLIFPAYLKDIFVIIELITLFGVSGLVFHDELAIEKRFTLVALVDV